MLSGVPALMLLAAQAASSVGPPAPEAPKPKAQPAQPVETCRNSLPTEPGEVVVCAVRPQGYRIDPDVLEAQRQKKRNRRPRGQERFADKSCATVGPMGCRGVAAVNLLAVAATAAAMAKRLSEGKEIGSMFRTTPEPTEYDLYLEAKRKREAEEAAAARAKPAAATGTSSAKSD